MFLKVQGFKAGVYQISRGICGVHRYLLKCMYDENRRKKMK